MGNAVLKITDGTPINTIDLFSATFGYMLFDWNPSRPELDLILNKNWFSGIETPANVVQKPTLETFTFQARHRDADSLILEEQKLNRILYMASLYWTGDRAVNLPFYLVAKNRDETGLRYAIIFSAQFHSSNNPYKSPFFAQEPTSVDLIVPISHGTWLDHPPGTDGVTMYENVTSTIDSLITYRNQGAHFLNDQARITLGNMLSHAGITHIYHQALDNLITRPEFEGYDLSGSGIGNYTYYGMERREPVVEPSGYAFPGITFNVTTPATVASGDPAFEWEVYVDANPGGLPDIRWVSIMVEDGTKGFTEPGTVLFNIPGYSFEDYNHNGTVGYWVRVHPTTTLVQVPGVTIKHPSIPSLPYFDVLLAGDEHNPILQPGDVIFSPPIPTKHIIKHQLHIEDVGSTFYSSGTEPFYVEAVGEYSEIFGGTITEHKYQIYLPDGTTGAYYGDRSPVLFNQGGQFTIYHEIEDDGGGGVLVQIVGYWDPVDPFKVFPGFFTVNPTITATSNAQFYFGEGTYWRYYSPGDTIDYTKIYWGDGQTVTYPGTIPPATLTHAYATPGLYTVSFEIAFVSGKVAWCHKYNAMNITGSQNARAAFEADERRGNAPFTVTFDGTLSESDSGITVYQWEFGDGNTGIGPNPTHTYTQKGIYTVQLRIVDTGGGDDTVIYYDYIYVDSALFYPGDNGIYLKFGFKPSTSLWGKSPPNKMYIGARSLVGKRDERFFGYIPPYNKGSGNPSGVVLHRSASTADIVANENSYTGYVYERIMDIAEDPAVGDEEIFTSLYFGSSSYLRYRGSYRMFLRINCDTSLLKGHVYFSAGVRSVTPSYGISGSLNRTRRVSDALGPDYITLLDLGAVTIGGSAAVTQNLDVFWQIIGAKGGEKIWLYDVVLIPQDEWFTEISFPDYNFQYGQTHELTVGSLTYDGTLACEITKSVTDDLNSPSFVESKPSTIPGVPLATLGKDMRFTILSSRYDSRIPQTIPSVPVQYSDFNTFYEITKVIKVNRYLGSRGPR